MGCISIRNLTLALAVGLVVISGGLTGYMSISTGERALDSTRDMYKDGLRQTENARDASLDACFDAGISNSRLLAIALAGKAVDEIIARLEALLDQPRALMASVTQWLSLQDTCFGTNGEYIDCNIKHKHWEDRSESPFLYSQVKDSFRRGVTELMIFHYPEFNFTASLYYLSPVTVSAEARQKFGVDPDYYQIFKINLDSPCTTHMNEQECKNYPPPGVELPPYMTQENWDKPGKNSGCLWCVRDHSVDQHLPIAANPDYYGEPGHCRQLHNCDPGFKADPTQGHTPATRDQLFLSNLDEYGVSRYGPCKSWAEAAREKDAVALSCSVPRSLDAFDSVIADGLTNKRFLQSKDTYSWSPITGKGPVVTMMLNNAWLDKRMWDYGPAAVASQVPFYIHVGVDVKLVSGFMKEIASALQPGTVLYGTQTHPDLIDVGKPGWECVDDPNGFSGVAQISCGILAQFVGCETDLSTVTHVATHTWVDIICPKSCNVCADNRTDMPPARARGQGNLVGTTHGESNAVLPLDKSTFGSIGMEDAVPINIWDAPDPVVRSHGRYMLSQSTDMGYGYDSLSYEGVSEWWYDPSEANVTVTPYRGASYNATADLGPRVLYWVKFAKITEEDRRLSLHLALLIPRDEAMKTIDAATTKTQAEAAATAERIAAGIQEETKRVDSKKEDDFEVMLIVVVLSCFVLMVISVVFVLSIIRPLQELEAEMAAVAKMHLELVDTGRSPHALKEVGSMQKSFFTMVKNLIEYRNYMPASVLVDDEEEEEEEEPEPTSRGNSGIGNSIKEVGELNDMQVSVHSKDTSNKSVAKSHKSMSVANRSAKPQAIAFGEGLKKRALSMSVLGVSKWHSVVEADTDLAPKFATFLACVLDVYSSYKGIPETFNGDRITCSWNTVKACGTHRPKCAEACEQLGQKVKVCLTEVGIQREVHIAGVTGDSRTGNIGCVGMKKYAIMGGMVTYMYLIERVAKNLGVVVLVDRWVEQETKNNFLYRAAEYILFNKRSPKPMLLYEMTGKKSASEDEWMYQ
eukprot:Hpha_TRINITY_DN16560_c2_g12::TRINITY_DN16560_c2_g12_i1::g.133706::m.133706